MMAPAHSRVYEKIKEATDYIRKKVPYTPEVAVVLGSGLGALAEKIKDPIVIPYSDIPYFHRTAVEGHAGKMIIGDFEGVKTAFLQGRFHFYEGHTMEEVVFPTRTVAALGVHTVILTNAAGGINTRYRPGDIMLIEDHINLMGDNPLRGPNLSELGPRFPDMTEAYARDVISIMQETAEKLEMEIHQGVYVGLLGPTYETPAEIRMLRTLGGDAVGMSTVHECIAAVHLGVRVCGISCITNLAAGLSNQKLTHQEVIENSAKGVGKIKTLLEAAIPRMSHPSKGA